MDDLLSQIGNLFMEVVTNLTNPDAWKAALENPKVTLAAFIVLNLIVFTETGLLFGFFLPGDSLLVTAGVVAHLVGWDIYLLISTLCISAIMGNSVGYLIGSKTGPAIFNRPQSRFFKRDHLLAAKAFYDRHGGKTIIFAQFMPFARTFCPVVAGAAKMEYRHFLFYNVIGAILWVAGMVLLGYVLESLLDPLLKPIFGPEFRIQKQIDKVVIVVVLVSVSPMAYKGLKHWLAKRKARAAGLHVTNSSTTPTP